MKKKIILVIIVALVLAAWYFAIRQPSVHVQKLDRNAKRATIQIGNKTVEYVFDKNSGMQIPAINIGYSASIEPSGPFQAVVKVKRYGTTINQHIINF